ncbi:52 kDa repressor of the inhibitor of the protein kinase-like [Stegodyphus dumicola]|uniref:52 kDa repressor of the inhibitor of the protein kinase-like n=1 Tax=Stegodyphus dumicola TaxID=202533 RepID=UPI0015AC7345|nr:52 kDa repressor of the inhibitor of the protein kinase-like [Stegodyphus dumicola]
MAYRYCRFKGCNRKIESKSDGIHFYRFPKEEQRCQAWVKASQNEKLVGVPASDLHKRAYLCMVHFEDWCFVNITTKHRLVHNAVPCSTKLQVTKGLVPDKVPELSHMTVPNSVTNGSVRDKMPEINHITVPSSEHHQSDFQQELISNVQGPNNLYQNVCSTELSTCNASLMSLIPQQSFSTPVSCSTHRSHIILGKKIHTQKITIVKKS